MKDFDFKKQKPNTTTTKTRYNYKSLSSLAISDRIFSKQIGIGYLSKYFLFIKIR